MHSIQHPLRGPARLLTALLSTLALSALGACGAGVPAGLVVLPGSTQAPNPEGAGAIVERPFFHTFGKVPFGSTVTHVFELENTERVPISILRITPGCSCTVPRITAVSPSGERSEGRPSDSGRLLTVPPGWIAELELSIDTRGREVVSNVDKLVTVRLMSDSALTPFIGLELHLKVVRPLELVPAEFNLDRLATSIGGRAQVRIVSREPHDSEPVEIVASPEGVEVELYPDPSSPGGVWILDARVAADLPPGPLLGEVAVRTVQGDGPGLTLAVPLRVEIVPDLSVEPAKLTLMPNAQGELPERGASIFLRLPGETFRVQRVGLVGEQREILEVEALPFEPREDGSSNRWEIDLRVTGPPTAETFSGEIELQLLGAAADPDELTELRIPYDGIFLP